MLRKKDTTYIFKLFPDIFESWQTNKLNCELKKDFEKKIYVLLWHSLVNFYYFFRNSISTENQRHFRNFGFRMKYEHCVYHGFAAPLIPKPFVEIQALKHERCYK